MKYKFLLISLWSLLLLSCNITQPKRQSHSSIKKAMLKAVQWQEQHPIYARAPTDWTNGAYYTGVSKAFEATKDSAFLKALITMGERNNWQPWERFYHADDLAICYNYIYMQLLGIKNVNLEPTEKIIKEHLFKPHPWRSGVPIKKTDANEPDEKSILWWWCDALFMAPPVISAYAKMNKDYSLLQELDKYYKQTYNLLYDKENHLFFRDTRFKWKGINDDLKENNGKKVFWSRGNGWVLAGLALLLPNIPEEYPSRIFYEELFKEMATRIIELQPKDGLWRTSLLCPESYDHGEVSGSGFYTFAIAWGINNGILDKNIYKPIVLKAWKSILACQKEDGKIGWVQNIGANPMPASADSWQNYGTGAFLLAASEVLKMK